MKISVLGAGGWGIALALKAIKNNNDVFLWTPFETEKDELSKNRESKKLLPGIKIPESIKITTDLFDLNCSDIVVLATPSFAVRETAKKLKSVSFEIAVSVSKGFEKDTLKRLSEVIFEELPDRKIAVLSGPSHAEEVSRDIPTTVVCASKDEAVAKTVQKAFMGDSFRIYTQSDVVGVEVGGAVKNVIAIAAGIEAGLSLGDNTRAALITRGLTEISRLGVLMGGKPNTFMGLSGMGDLVVTCMSEHSRNNRFGKLIGQGTDVKTALEKVGTVEGYYAVKTVCDLAEKFGVDMPITKQCKKILYENENPRDALKKLMTRPEKSEEELL